MGFGDVGVSSRKVAPVGVEKPACAGVLFVAAPYQWQNKFCRWFRLAPLVYLRGEVKSTLF